VLAGRGWGDEDGDGRQTMLINQTLGRLAFPQTAAGKRPSDRNAGSVERRQSRHRSSGLNVLDRRTIN